MLKPFVRLATIAFAFSTALLSVPVSAQEWPPGYYICPNDGTAWEDGALCRQHCGRICFDPIGPAESKLGSTSPLMERKPVEPLSEAQLRELSLALASS